MGASAGACGGKLNSHKELLAVSRILSNFYEANGLKDFALFFRSAWQEPVSIQLA
jgi:hypothetical protein